MNYKLYIGSLELNIISDIDINFYEFDALFENKVLPTTKTFNIYIKKETVHWNAEKYMYEKNNMKLFQKNGLEYRIYNGKKEKGIHSIFDPNSEEVHVFLPEDDTIISHRFRPWFQIHLETLLLHNNALILHSASIDYNNNALLFCAPSGTGKTTQTDLWHQYKNNVKDINGDRTLIQLFHNEWYACGFPIYGSSVRCNQTAVPIRAIILLKQSNHNSLRQLNDKEKFLFLYKEITQLPSNQTDVLLTMNLIEKLLHDVDIIELNCTISKEAVNILDQYISGD